ncbi:GDSL esterase/lipase At5g45910-like [Carex rostrata]
MEIALALFLLLVSSFPFSSSVPSPKYNALFCFGNSYSDTGNFNILARGTVPFNIFEHLPYGITYFGHPNGRASDGRLSIDFMAQALGLPLLPPSLLEGQDFSKGANFAVSGATALSLSFYMQNAIIVAPLNISLNVQIGWFQDLKPSLCNTTESCNDYLSKALFILGEIGGNDYDYMLFSHKTIDYVKSYVPTVIETINTAAESLLKQGVMHLMLTGLGPVGCTPIILTIFASTNKSDYDSSGCLKKYNTIASYHTQLLSEAVTQLRAKYPQARIIFADYYGPVIAVLQTPELFGITNGAPLKVCCGGGGPYNYDMSAICGQPGVTACENPSTYLNWDGIHLTEAAYRSIANSWLRGPFANPPILGP